MTVSQFAKIAISAEADGALSKTVDRVNENFSGGRVTKADLASWFLLRSAENLDEKTTDEIQKAHFNSVAYLDALVKKLKASGREVLEMPEIEALQSMIGGQVSKKRGRPNKTPASPSDQETN